MKTNPHNNSGSLGDIQEEWTMKKKRMPLALKIFLQYRGEYIMHKKFSLI